MRQIIQPPAERSGTRCDRCGGPLSAQKLGEAFSQTFRFDFTGGYGSCFGDGTHVHGNFCERCIKQVYGPYLRRYVESRDGESGRGRVVMVCDRCGRQISQDDWVEWQEALTIRFPDPSSDDAVMETDLCQHCVMHTMGAWLRITEDYALPAKRRPAPKPKWVFSHRTLEEEWSEALNPDAQDRRS